MVLFTDIEGILIKKCFYKNNIFKSININKKIFSWIKFQNFERIFIITNQKGIAEGWLDEKLFDFEIGYLTRILELYTNVKVEIRYFPYKESNAFLIQDLLKEFDIKNAVVLKNRKGYKKDELISGLKYIYVKDILI